MSVQHIIDKHSNLIVTVWTGEPNDSEMVAAYQKYQQEIKSKPEYETYNEIVDFSNASGVYLTLEGIKKVMRIAVKYDQKEIKTKLAFVSKSILIYNLALVYETFRSLLPNANKELRVFKKLADAYQWMGINPDTAK